MSAQTIARYRTRMWHFCCWLDFMGKLVPETRWELDNVLRGFIEDVWATSDPFTWSESTLAAMQHFALNFWGESMAPGARSAPGGAQNFPIAPPLPPIVVRGIAGLAVVQNGDDVVVGIFLAFHCMLRGAEVIELQVGSINLFRETAVLNLGLTKSGLSRWACEQVTVQDARLVIFLSMLIGSRDKRSHTSTFSAVAFALCCATPHFSSSAMRDTLSTLYGGEGRRTFSVQLRIWAPRWSMADGPRWRQFASTSPKALRFSPTTP